MVVSGTPARPARWRRGVRLCAGILLTTLLYTALAPFVFLIVDKALSALRYQDVQRLASGWGELFTWWFFLAGDSATGMVFGFVFSVAMAVALHFQKGGVLTRLVIALLVTSLVASPQFYSLWPNLWPGLRDAMIPGTILLLIMPRVWLKRILMRL